MQGKRMQISYSALVPQVRLFNDRRSDAVKGDLAWFKEITSDQIVYLVVRIDPR